MIEDFPDQQVFWGAQGSISFLKEKLAVNGYCRIFLVTGRESYISSGAEHFIEEALGRVEFQRHYDFSPNPELNDLLSGLKEIAKYRPDCIIAVGGGSVIDMAKLLNFFLISSLDPKAYLDGDCVYKGEALLPLIAIPTTAGTGSEATHFSVLYRNNIKYSVAEACMIPNVTILNPELAKTMSPYQTGCTGMDALAQGIESHWAVGATSESRTYAVKGIRLALQYLQQAVLSPDDESRNGMLKAAYWSGRAINISKTTLCHAMSYSISSHFGLPHGHAVSLTLPMVILYNLERIPQEDVNELLMIMGFASLAEAAAQVASLIHQIGLEQTLPTSTYDLFNILNNEINLERLKNNPCSVSENTLLEIAKRVAEYE